MSVTSAIAIYFVMWWITLFAILPWRIRSQHEGDGYHLGTDPGAPVAARIAWRLLWTTIVSAVLFAVGVYAYQQGWFNIERLSHWMGVPF